MTNQLPDSDTTVLVHAPLASEPVWLGYHDGQMWWYADTLPAPGVTHWAEMPAPPGA